ncbi:LacI family DNA-binding transcriptional regulator [Mesorhizobium sp. A556]
MSDRSPVSRKRTTIYDLASLAGASPTAVSSVLNGTWKKRRISAALAEKIERIAGETGYAPNTQASGLRREKSNLIGMIVPKYDNRYFGSIVERFEAMARDRGLFPIITCTRREAELEIQAAKEMISHQVSCLIATGATDPDRITELCANSGVRSLNLDLPGSLAPSVISDNRGGARALARRILQASQAERAPGEPLLYIGGRLSDHNTAERIQGFREAHSEFGVAVREEWILAGGYSPDKAENTLRDYAARHERMPAAFFVSSTITLEGVIRWLKARGLHGDRLPHIGCFDWDPLAEALNENIVMLRQDVPRMLDELFRLVVDGHDQATRIEIPTLLGPDFTPIR